MIKKSILEINMDTPPTIILPKNDNFRDNNNKKI